MATVAEGRDVTPAGFSSPLAEALADDVLERFLRYVRIDTQSREGAETYPSTAKQLDLSRLLAGELRDLGLADAHVDAHGYVLATLPATVAGTAPTVGLIAHVDTSPEASGTGVRPQ
ncbi:MAG: peptidase T, partial [Chloroflexota bacterium]